MRIHHEHLRTSGENVQSRGNLLSEWISPHEAFSNVCCRHGQGHAKDQWLRTTGSWQSLPNTSGAKNGKAFKPHLGSSRSTCERLTASSSWKFRAWNCSLLHRPCRDWLAPLPVLDIVSTLRFLVVGVNDITPSQCTLPPDSSLSVCGSVCLPFLHSTPIWVKFQLNWTWQSCTNTVLTYSVCEFLQDWKWM